MGPVVALKTRGLRIATRCLTLDQFVATFHRFCDAQTVFISTLTPRTVGLETAFSIDLADDTPALRGVGVVLESWASPQNPFGRPGLKLGIKKLATESAPIFDRLLFAREALAETPTSVASMMPSIVIAKRPAATEPIEGQRTPGSELVLPANPLMNIDDKSLAGFVDCTLYEETGNFFPEQPVVEDPADPVVAPPLLAPRRISTQLAASSPTVVASLAKTVAAAGTLPPATQPVVNKLTPPMGASAFVPSDRLTFGSRAQPAPRTVPPETVQTATEIAERMALPSDPVPRPAPQLGTRARSAPPPLPGSAPNVTAKAAWLSSETAEMLEAEIESEPSVVSTRPVESGTAPRPPSLAELELAPQSHAPAPQYPAYEQHTHASGAYRLEAPPAAQISNAFPVQPYRAVQRQWHRKRWLMIGGIATATVAIALIAASHTGGTSTTASAEPTKARLVASNTERTRPVVVPAHPDKPIADTLPTDVESEPAAEEVTATQIIGKGPCKIAISATPAGSMISVDGEPVGPSPLTVAGPCTKRRIDVSHPRYASSERFVTPKPEDTFDVTLVRPTHNLFVETQPSGAVVSIDGHRAGTSPTMVKVMGFSTLTLTIEKPGFKPQTAKVYSKTAVDRRSIKLSR
ncbi:hypothetical protein BH11MYX1_BH11MYX1_33180 [soil metagenome]